MDNIRLNRPAASTSKEDSKDKGFQRGCAYYEYINGEDKVFFTAVVTYLKIQL